MSQPFPSVFFHEDSCPDEEGEAPSRPPQRRHIESGRDDEKAPSPLVSAPSASQASSTSRQTREDRIAARPKKNQAAWKDDVVPSGAELVGGTSGLMAKGEQTFLEPSDAAKMFITHISVIGLLVRATNIQSFTTAAAKSGLFK